MSESSQGFKSPILRQIVTEAAPHTAGSPLSCGPPVCWHGAMRPHLVVAVVASAALLGGCGSTAMPSTPPAPPSGGPSESTPPGRADIFPVVITRRGGIAGFSDRLTVQADGSARTSTRRGVGAPCRLTEAALKRLEQAVTGLAASPPPPPTSTTRVSDELVTTVQTPAARQVLRLSDAPVGAVAVVGELVTELSTDPGTRSLCLPG